MLSTFGLSSRPRNRLAYDDKDSTYLRCPSAKIVSKTNVLLPDPEGPVTTTSLSRGISTSIDLRLFSSAFLTLM